LTDRVWKKAREVQNIMDLLVRVLKIVDQDKKPIKSIIYEAMDRVQLAIKASNKNWKKYLDIVENDGRDNCIDTCMLLVIHLPTYNLYLLTRN